MSSELSDGNPLRFLDPSARQEQEVSCNSKLGAWKLSSAEDSARRRWRLKFDPKGTKHQAVIREWEMKPNPNPNANPDTRKPSENGR